MPYQAVNSRVDLRTAKKTTALFVIRQIERSENVPIRERLGKQPDEFATTGLTIRGMYSPWFWSSWNHSRIPLLHWREVLSRYHLFAATLVQTQATLAREAGTPESGLTRPQEPQEHPR